MSTKTLRKRIALVAVAALGAGVLASAPANATAGTGVFVTAGISGSGIIVAATGTDVSQTITVGSDAQISIVMVEGAVNSGTEGGRVVVTGGTIVGSTSALAGTSTSLQYGDTTPTITVKPDAGTSVMLVTTYVNAAAALAGTAAAKLTATIKASASVGVASAAYSLVRIADDASDSDISNSVDSTTGGKSVSVANVARINWSLKDGNNIAMPATTVVTATATGGCVVSMSTSGFLSASTTEQAASGDTYVARPVAGTPLTCTISLTANGLPVATRTVTLQGKITKVEVDGGQAGIANASASSSATNDQAFSYSAYDAAGNAATGLTILNVATASESFSSVTTTDTTDPVDGAYGSITCSGAAKGSGSFYLYYVNSAAETIKSPVYTANCFGSPYTYAASFDKASYVPGDIATLTITAKDSKGNPANDYSFLGGTTAAGFGTTYPVSIAGSNMTAVTAPSSTDSFLLGKKTYKFVVGSTEGSYQMSIDLPKFNNTVAPQTSITAPYKIAGTGAVSNADVLKAIVSLIASINKQIAALQKALLKK